LLPASEA